MNIKIRTMYKKLAYGASALAIFAVSCFGALPAGATQSPQLPGFCKHLQIDVALQSGQPKNHKIAGTLCRPYWDFGQKEVDVLVHGATYNRSYWDMPFDHPKYSFVHRELAAQRTVFYYDRLGIGQSSKLPSESATLDADAYALHQVVQWLKRDKGYKEVNVVGHSFGSLIGILESSRYNDTSRLAVTGALQSVGPGLINGELKQYPANQDAQFAGMGYDNGWLTSMPGTKSPFYNTASADPNMIAYDDAHEDVVSNTQLIQGRAQRTMPPETNPTNQVKSPVLLLAGQQDRLYCLGQLDCTNEQAVKTWHAPYYTKARSLKVVTVADTGHDVALHPSAKQSAQSIIYWLYTTPAVR